MSKTKGEGRSASEKSGRVIDTQAYAKRKARKAEEKNWADKASPVETSQAWWVCQECGFNAKKFEPREEKQRGAIKWHQALHENGRLNGKD